MAVALALANAPAAEQKRSLMGATREQVLQRYGEPKSHIAAGTREVIFFARERVVLRNGVVVEIEALPADAPVRRPPTPNLTPEAPAAVSAPPPPSQAQPQGPIPVPADSGLPPGTTYVPDAASGSGSTGTFRQRNRQPGGAGGTAVGNQVRATALRSSPRPAPKQDAPSAASRAPVPESGSEPRAAARPPAPSSFDSPVEPNPNSAVDPADATKTEEPAPPPKK